MNAHSPIEADPLSAGFYTPADVARLIGVPSSKTRGWLNGWAGSDSGPIIDRDFKHTSTISFLDLMEMRFVEYFRSQKVPMTTLRRAAEKARKDWDSSHPFALSKAKYLTDRRKIFAQAAEENGDQTTWDLASGQHEMWETIETVIAKGVMFDPASNLAKTWHPRAGDFPSVVIDPRRAFGQPTVGDSGMPTSALYRQWRAEKGNYDRVASWYDVSRADVESAVEFEMQIAA